MNVLFQIRSKNNYYQRKFQSHHDRKTKHKTFVLFRFEEITTQFNKKWTLLIQKNLGIPKGN